MIEKIKTIIKSFLPAPKNSFDDEVPWITFSAINWLEKYLKKNMDVFEWGSGGSTLYIAPKVKKIISIEHDEKWFKKVMKRLKSKKIINCECKLIKPEADFNKTNDSLKDLSQYKSNSEQFLSFKFENYCKAIDGYPESYFDLIIIDGRARPSCILHSKNKVKIGGYILVDDSDRATYSEGFNLLKDFKRTDFFGPGPYLNFPWGTSVFQRIN
jgi:hypothetical protein